MVNRLYLYFSFLRRLGTFTRHHSQLSTVPPAHQSLTFTATGAMRGLQFFPTEMQIGKAGNQTANPWIRRTNLLSTSIKMVTQQPGKRVNTPGRPILTTTVPGQCLMN